MSRADTTSSSRSGCSSTSVWRTIGTFGAVIDRSLTDRGRGLLHFIGRNRPGPLNPWIRKRIFPGAYPPTLPEVCERVFEPQNLSVLDVENLRLHYAATLDHWRGRFDAAADRVTEMFDETFVRAWRLYLAGSQAAFVTGTMQLFPDRGRAREQQRHSVDAAKLMSMIGRHALPAGRRRRTNSRAQACFDRT